MNPDELGTLGEDGLVRWTPRPMPAGPRTVGDVLDAVLATDPERVALLDDDVAMTYGQLDVEADRAARALLGLGVRPGDRVAVSLPNCPAIVVLFLGAMRIGAVWVGINQVLARPEQEALLADSGATLLVNDGALSQADVGPGLRVLGLGQWTSLVEAAEATRPEIDVDPLAPAAIAYTSGTTGAPKGVVHSQHNIVLPGTVSLLSHAVPAHLRQGVVIPLTILNLMILGPVTAFICGATCVLLRRIDVLGLADGVRRQRVQRLSAPPTTAYDLLTHPGVQDADIASLTDLGVGGASTPPGLNDRYRARFGRLFATSYGLTEVPTIVTFDERPDRPADSSGRALDHLSVSIADGDGRPLPTGAEGEIWVGPRTEGPFAHVFRPMLGYWKRPEATRAALAPGGWLRTGDHGRLAADGSLTVVGRRNDVILRGGANVYPAEIEEALLTHPEVAEAAVVGRPHERLGETVVAVLRLSPGSSLDEGSLRAHLEPRLARYKLPREFHFVDELPRNAMGKVVKARVRAELIGRA